MRTVAVTVAAALLLAGCHQISSSDRVEVFAAASLGPFLYSLVKEFKAAHPGHEVAVELSGSRLACAKVTDQKRRADVVLSADYHLIDAIMVPKFASFDLLFANNAVVLAYNRHSSVAAKLASGEPWQKVIADPSVAVGIANPAVAPVGYRALLALQLNDRVAPAPLRLGAEIRAHLRRRNERPDVTKLVAPLEAGELDVAFVYRSEAMLHHLAFVHLDPQIDFSSLARDAFYRTASVTIPAFGKRPPRTMHGGAAVYGLTVPYNAPHPRLAQAFVELLMSGTGRRLANAAFIGIKDPQQMRLHGTAPGYLGAIARR